MKGHGNKKYRVHKIVLVETEEEAPLNGALKPRCILDYNTNWIL